ncbi:hypothetical protein M409DRAFT_21222 [Zasmidium cellare ATCC 36951]|uniref:DUF7492 domain-containing protein n=1 Tax=Zasmidium cellare ATCC 36951 TaxID=1080233 RepID=A0A6A6CP86_ZASCE|nr:uncharacterized protein M409DRAFT_21222 [Zasmidium cellare ATCC 36951]KAF2168473.1 hypothetical protein M409DRAFT_21222 [Zasmidium cellare ATCC 36951]
MSSFAKMISLAALVATLLPFTSAHSWVEEYQVIQPDGSYVGARGYSRGYLSRTDPGYNGNSLMWMLPGLSARNTDGTTRVRIDSSDPICHPAQRTSNYTSEYPKLKVQPGDYVAMKYLENGHVSLPWNITGKPPGTGTVFVFGTTQASDDEKIVDVMNWNKDGSGGNKKGFLMTAQNFDDGRCTQINCGNISAQRQMLEPNHVAGQPSSTIESWCETDLKIPENVKAGTLTTYWVWQWPTEPNRDCNTPAGKDEYYTTCADFDVVDSGGTSNKAAAPFSASAGENPQSVAVKTFKSRTAYTNQPTFVAMSNNKLVGDLATVNKAFVSSCSTQASVISANNLGMWPQVYVPNTCDVVSTFGPAAASAAAAKFGQAASSYSAQATAAWSAAFAKANMAVPSRAPWSRAPQTGGAQMTATSAPAATSAPSNYSAPAAAPSAAPSSSSAAAAPPAPAPSNGAITSLYTVTTILTLTSTLPPGQAAPSQPAAPAAPADTLSTITTVGSAAAAIPSIAGNGTLAYRRHARDVTC